MRKEVWFAIVGGVILGLIIGFGVYRVNSSFKKQNIQNTPTPSSENKDGISFAKPNYDDVITKSPVVISGIASKKNWLVISTESKDYLSEIKKDGTFEDEIELTGGINKILAWAVSENGSLSNTELRLVYTTQLETPRPNDNEKESSESAVKESVLKKVEDVLNTPKAYLGTVTDIAEKTIQLKTDSGNIEQVSGKDENLTVIKELPSAKEVKYADIAIGDYIVAMGLTNGNHVLNAKRILITQPEPPLDIKILFGKVELIDKKQITLEGNLKAVINTSTKLSDKNIKEADLVIIVVKEIKEITTARSIFLVELKPQ